MKKMIFGLCAAVLAMAMVSCGNKKEEVPVVQEVKQEVVKPAAKQASVTYTDAQLGKKLNYVNLDISASAQITNVTLTDIEKKKEITSWGMEIPYGWKKMTISYKNGADKADGTVTVTLPDDLRYYEHYFDATGLWLRGFVGDHLSGDDPYDPDCSHREYFFHKNGFNGKINSPQTIDKKKVVYK